MFTEGHSSVLPSLWAAIISHTNITRRLSWAPHEALGKGVIMKVQPKRKEKKRDFGDHLFTEYYRDHEYGENGVAFFLNSQRQEKCCFKVSALFLSQQPHSWPPLCSWVPSVPWALPSNLQDPVLYNTPNPTLTF